MECISNEDYKRLIGGITDETELEYLKYFCIKPREKFNYNTDENPTPGEYKPWNGSCYGMTTVVCLVNGGIIPAHYLADGKASLSTSTNTKKTISAINFYHWQQGLAIKRGLRAEFIAKSQEEQMKELIQKAEAAQNGGMLVNLCYSYYDKSCFDSNGNLLKTGSIKRIGHSVAVYGVEDGNWDSKSVKGLGPKDMVYNKRILVCDPNGKEETRHLYYSEESKHWCIPEDAIQSLDVISEEEVTNISHNGKLTLDGNTPELFNNVDYLTGKYSVSGSQGTNVDSSSDNRAFVTSVGNSYHVKTDAGEADVSGSVVRNSTFSESIPSMPGFDDTEGDGGQGQTYALFPSSTGTELSTEDEGLSFHVESGNRGCIVGSSSAGTFFFDKDGHATVETKEKAESHIRSTSNDKNEEIGGCATIEVSAKDSQKLSLNPSEGGLVVSGDNLSSIQIEGYDSLDSMFELDVKTESREVVIREQSGQMVASVDTDGDGSCDTVVAKSKIKKRPGAVKIKKAVKKNGKKLKKKKKINLKLVWSKAKSASGYEVQASESKYFLTPKTYRTSKTKIKLKKLKAAGYYIRVRAYTKYGKQSLNGAWSKTKHIK